MKKISLLLSILLCGLILTACNSENKPQNNNSNPINTASDSNVSDSSDTSEPTIEEKNLEFFNDKIVVYGGLPGGQGTGVFEETTFGNIGLSADVYEDFLTNYLNDDCYFMMGVKISYNNENKINKAREICKSLGIPVCDHLSLEEASMSYGNFCIIANKSDLEALNTYTDVNFELRPYDGGYTLEHFYPEYNPQLSNISVVSSVDDYYLKYPEKKIQRNVNEKLKEKDTLSVKIILADIITGDPHYNIDFGEGEEYYKNYNQFIVDKLLKDYKITNISTNSLDVTATLTKEEMLAVTKNMPVIRIELAE